MVPTNRIKSEILDRDGINHGFFTRSGGASRGVFDSLNCSPYSEDVAQSIEENRRRVMCTLGADRLCSLKQVHGNRVYVIEDRDALQDGLEGDGLVCNVPGVCIGVLTADCAPVLFWDDIARVVGAAHAGWLGALNGITDSVIEKMESLGADVSRIKCAVGPSIQLSSYEVGEQFKESFLTQSPIPSESYFSHMKPDGAVHFDLAGYVEERLVLSGIQSIDNLGYDTYSDEAQFFSYRRACHRNETLYGRQMSAVTIT